MTVKELIEKLSQFSPDTIAVIETDGQGFYPVEDARLVGLLPMDMSEGLRYPRPIGPESRMALPPYILIE